MRQLFHISQLLIEEQRGIVGMSTIDWRSSPWDRATLLNDRLVQLSKAKVYVVPDSVLFQGKVLQSKEAVDTWKTRIELFRTTPQYRDLDLIDGEAKGVQVENFPKAHNIAVTRRG